MDEILKRDADRNPVLGAVTDDANLEVRNLRVDPVTGALLVSADGGGGGGDVDGPAGATEDNIVTFDGATGKIIKDGGAKISDLVPYTGATTNVDLGAHNLTVDTDTLFVDSANHKVGAGTTTPVDTLTAYSDIDGDSNYITIDGATDKSKGFKIATGGVEKWSDSIFEGEDGDTRYTYSNNSQRDIVAIQSGGRIGLNVPTLLSDIEILRFVQTGTNTYATITCEYPHRMANNTPIVIEGATTAKFNGNFIITNVSTMTFRINGLEVGAVTEDPTDAKVIQDTMIPAALAVFPQYFDSVYTFNKALDTGAGTGYTNISGDMRTSFGTADTIIYSTSGSYLYLGKKYPWRATNFNIVTPSAGSSAITVEYSTADSWVALTTSTTSGNSLVDGTSRLTKDGNITWDLRTFKDAWKQQIFQVNPSPQYTQNLYWIRISLNAVTTEPTAKAIGNHGIDRLGIYAQSGDVNPVLSVDAMGRVGFLPAELETKYALGTLPGLQSSKFEVVAEDGTRSDFLYYLANDSSDQHPAVILARSSGTVAAKTPVINGMDLGGVYAEAYDGATFRDVGKILFESAKLATSGDASGRMSFWTRNATTASAERMRITEDGKVGIGTLVPEKALDINSATGDCLQLTYNDNNGSAANKATFAVSSSGDLTIAPSGGDLAITGNITADSIKLTTGAGAGKILTSDADGDATWETPSGSSFWTAVPTTSGYTTGQIDITDTGNAGKYDLLLCPGTILKWTDSGNIKIGRVYSSSYSSDTVTLLVIGDTISTIDANSLKYAMNKSEVKVFTYPSTTAVGTDVSARFYCDKAYKVYGAKAYLATAGTTNNLTIDLNKNGTTMFSSKPPVATGATVGTVTSADSGTVTAVDDYISLDIDSVSNTPGVGLYVELYISPLYDYLLS